MSDISLDLVFFICRLGIITLTSQGNPGPACLALNPALCLWAASALSGLTCHEGLGPPGLLPMAGMEGREALEAPCFLGLFPLSDSKGSSPLQGARKIKYHWLLLHQGQAGASRA